MAENERYDRDNLALTGTTSFSHLLFAEDDSVGLDVNQIFKCTSSAFPSEKKPKMLCFGDYPNRAGEILFSDTTTTTTTTRMSQRSGVTCSDSSSSPSSTNSVISTMSKSINRKRNGSGQESVQCTSTITASPVSNQRTSKKIKTESPTSTAPPKRKEKLGERIAALQQLVSPFGKTDTASVLHEAMGYIRFLQEQVQVLCSPYLQQQRLPSLPDKEGGENGEKKEGRKDLRSRGLCLVPVEFTVHVANTNGADLWSPAMASKQ